MSDVRYEWNPRKAAQNQRKHGVSFQEATTVFDDPYAIVKPDEEHSGKEERQLIIGTSKRSRLLLVIFLESAIDLIRLISARKAVPRERQEYEETN